MSSSSSANYLLVDGVLRPDALTALTQLDASLEIEPLYLGTPWAELRDLGPILVAINNSPNLIDETLRSKSWQSDATLLESDASFSEVAEHLRRFIAPPDVLGGNGLLRFADPLITRYWLDSYQDAQLDAVLGPINSWYVPENPHSWELSQVPVWRNFFRVTAHAEWIDVLGKLGEEQLTALEQAGRWRFMEQLYQSFEQSHPQHLARIGEKHLSQWFNDRLNQAQDWGLSSERSLAIWVEYSLRWGDDFTSRPDDPYQQWLARTPDAHRLAPEIRIQQMDDGCLDIELNKEA